MEGEEEERHVGSLTQKGTISELKTHHWQWSRLFFHLHIYQGRKFDTQVNNHLPSLLFIAAIKRSCSGLPDFSCYAQHTKTGENVPNNRQIYHMAVKFTEWL
jgi:hypothetical protein